ncbi:TIGR02186 family protein [Halodesulfovibrio aestuarii]|uniref:TIGR02186 family protein n=1 Tax=Halodesulfovibrio aestuarii TaxID=126333 RepID=A0A8G2C980_9BACT|nr:TIGR02186 family protein [Halodesulfovibrio aestuarii]SHJ05124.1 conserved hypothetical protein [Halodesulfovibrio aestuarii]
MKTVTFFRLAMAAFCLFVVSAVSVPAHAETDISAIKAAPESIAMGAQYDGIDLTVHGTVPEGSDVVLRFTGPPADMHLREKGKLFGLLWMNVGKVAVKNVPNVCLVDSSRPFDQLGAAVASYRLEGLRDAVEVEKTTELPKIDVAHELILLKEQDGMYHESEGGIVFGKVVDGMQSYTAKLHIPSALSPGKYLVEAAVLRDGIIIGKNTAPVEAALVGFPKWLSSMAFDNSLLYGVLATIIAIFSGLIIGMVFQSKGAH